MPSISIKQIEKTLLRKIQILISLIVVLTINAVVTNSQSLPDNSAGSIAIKQWVERHFAKGEIPPFSFVYKGKNSNNFITGWEYKAEEIQSSESNTEVFLYTYTDKKTGLSVKCRVTGFIDFPAVEWVLTFINSSSKNTPFLEKVAAIDYSFIESEAGTFILHHARGSEAGRNDFMSIDENMELNKSVYITPSGGRSSDGAALPFFNIETSGRHGIMVAIGWTGKWYANVEQVNEKTVALRSGMEKMKTILYPKEEIRTPLICLLFWNGEDRMVGHNQFRQFVLAHHSRKIDGCFAEYPLSGSFDYGDPDPCGEYNCLTEEFAIALVNRYKFFKILPEVFWLDAGWYTGCAWDKDKGSWWKNVGNWTVDKERFPNGLKAVSDAVHAVGAKFMVWFEPERVRPGTQFDKEHPEWIIKKPGSEEALFDLGNPEARIWLTNYISDIIRKEGIDNYRQDLNMDPKSYWELKDKPDRIGISEIRHIEGLYAYWDSLLVRFPHLLIDNCASGGRRIDLETTSRSAPLWRTDYQNWEPNGYQCHTYGLNFYLPIHGTDIPKTADYNFRSGLGATAVTGWEITGGFSDPILKIQELNKEFKSLRTYFYGDYYPLTGTDDITTDKVWLAYQLNRPVQEDGIILAFRRKDNTDESIRIRLRGLDKQADYELFYKDQDIRKTISGCELMNGIEISLSQGPSSLLIIYHKDGKI
jgi:alpha-galactosidase